MNRIENLSWVFQKQKKIHEGIEFHNSIQDWVLLPLAGCRKVLGKMPGPPTKTQPPTYI